MLLAALNEPAAVNPQGRRDEGFEGPKQNTILLLPYAVVKCAECITVRHLLGKIVAAAVSAACASASASFPDEDARAKAKCDHISSLPGVLTDILDSVGCEKFVLVMDGIDALKEGGQMLLAALGRLGELVCWITPVLLS